MVAKKKALGRGLGALIGDSEKIIENNENINEISISYIDVNPFQPRTRFDEEALNELSNSIKKLGIIQPITVRKIHNKEYQLITGERRLRASKLAGLTQIPAYIRTADDQAMLELALVENIQREDLDAIEVAISYQRLMEECKFTQEVLSDRVGKKRSTITNYLRLLKLPGEIQLGIKNKYISMGHARALVNIEDANSQMNIFKKIIDQGLSVRKVEDLVRDMDKHNNNNKEPDNSVNNNEEYVQLQKHLSDYFNTQIDFKRNLKGKGKIIIPFKTDEELERIVGILDKLNN
ncbi:MAG: ParB/RepB/Spo0J family partition protein [Bacteroidetes bacterium]|nr:ParB/RepB/Spo0J family partition protein [Bacteroidota bacterium]